MKASGFAGRIAGIEIRIHATFLLLPLWVFWRDSRADGVYAGLVSVGLILAIFFCVVLHELGHSLVARRTGVIVRRIVLYPFGGAAQLDRIPERPAQELAIAIAGPLVSAAIAGLLMLARGGWPDLEALLERPMSAGWFVDMLAATNVALAVFNLLPVFPSDGGRILRALLAFVMPYPRATAVAAWIGQIAAVGLAVLGWQTENPVLLLVSLALMFAARRESAWVRLRHRVRGRRAEEFAETSIPTLAPGDSADRALQLARETGRLHFPVMDGGRLVGVYSVRPRLADTLGGLLRRAPAGTVADRLRTHLLAIQADMEVEALLPHLLAGRQGLFPVVRDGAPVGFLTRESVLGRLAAEQPPPRGRWRLDFG